MLEETASTNSQTALKLQRVFDAPIEQVFLAWTQAEVIASWFGPEGFKVQSADIDLRIGGKYSIVIKPSDGPEIHHYGRYVEINSPNRLVFTWVLENQACEGSENLSAETLVTIELKPLDGSTQLTLLHERLPNKQAYDGHKYGWNSSFNCLQNQLLTN